MSPPAEPVRDAALAQPSVPETALVRAATSSSKARNRLGVPDHRGVGQNSPRIVPRATVKTHPDGVPAGLRDPAEHPSHGYTCEVTGDATATLVVTPIALLAKKSTMARSATCGASRSR